MIIAIDGPAGSGKSTVARLVAARLGFHYLDTGAMYRAVAISALQHDISLTDEDAVASLATSEEITFEHEGGEVLPTRVRIGGVDVTEAIRTPVADQAVSPVAKMCRVREALVAQQRQIGERGDVVVEGRDIGTVVFPQAEVKIFVTASTEERARRRAVQQSDSGVAVQQEAVLRAIERRDEIDSTREHSPLAAAADATRLDTTDLTIEQVVDAIVQLARGAGA